MTTVAKIAPGIEVEVTDTQAFLRNPLASNPLVELHALAPIYSTDAFDADGYLVDPIILDQHGFDWGHGCWADVHGDIPCNADVPDDDPLGLCPTHHHQLRSDA